MVFNKDSKGTDEVAVFATWTSNHNYAHLYQALLLAEKFVKTIIDKATYKLIDDHYNSDNYLVVPVEEAPVGEGDPPVEEEEPVDYTALDEAVYFLQAALVNFAYARNIHKDSVVYDNSGIQVKWSEEFRPAQQPTIDNLVDSFEKHGFEFLDLLISHFDDNQTIFPDWFTSEKYKAVKALFVNDAADFSYYFNINNSSSYFFYVMDMIRRVQRGEIYAALGATEYADALDYQSKHKECEGYAYTSATVAALAEISEPVDGSIALVVDVATFYKYITDEWVEYIADKRELLALIKPALVDLTMYYKFISDLNNLKDKDKARLEILRANAQFLKQQGDIEIEKLRAYVQEPVEDEEDGEIVHAVPLIVTNNSFAI